MSEEDELRTLDNSRALVLGTSEAAAIDAITKIRVLDPRTIQVLAGKVYFKSIGSLEQPILVKTTVGTFAPESAQLNLEQPVLVQTPAGTFAPLGTEFHLAVDPVTGASEMVSFDGQVVVIGGSGSPLTNAAGEKVILSTNAAAQPQGPVAAIHLNNIIQWMLYYPAVLDPEDLPWPGSPGEVPPELAPSLEAYRAGNVRQALESYPTNRPPASDAEAVYHAAVLLSVGRVDHAEQLLSRWPADAPAGTNAAARLAQAVRQLIAAVKFQPFERTAAPALASEWMAESYYRQSRTTRNSLESARAAARKAVEKSMEKSTNFSFGWARLAELDFSFGETKEAQRNLAKALASGPANAQAIALHGYLFAAENKIPRAIVAFAQALEVDPGLGNAWLGLGLCRIHRGEMEEGLRCLQLAVAAEPQRSLLRSYLGKAYGDVGQRVRAAGELKLAKDKDPADPTPWLYSALLKRQQNQINAAVRELETSQDLNDNRSVYRSGLLLDQDRAVRGANLAAIYRDAAMHDVSLREASRAVQSDYANYSAHLFLAESYAAFLDPRVSTLRFETPWANELFLANLLAPAGGSSLSQSISQQEYSRLFDRDYTGFFSLSDYASSGDWSQSGSVYGKTGPVGYAVDAYYLNQNGQQPNSDQELFQTWVTLQGQISPQDSVLAEVIYKNSQGGDPRLFYDPFDPETGASRTLRTKERQEPIVLAGYRHQWSPEHQTLLMVARLDNTALVTEPQFASEIRIVDSSGQPLTGIAPIPFTSALDYRNELAIYSGELQHIWQSQDTRFSTILGGRYQFGEFDTDATVSNPSGLPFLPPILYNTPVSDQDLNSSFDRVTAYAYQNFRVWEPLLLTAGVTYDRVHYPITLQPGPISPEENTKDQVSPKAGFIWTPTRHTSVRGGYTRSLGGVSFDQSFRLEPNQVSGFIQSYRSLIPESLVGSVPAATFETWGLSVDHRFTHGTYLGLTGELLESEGDHFDGIYSTRTLTPIAPDTLKSRLQYREKSLLFTANQLLGEEWAVGLRYRLSHTELEQSYEAPTEDDGKRSALLHQVNLTLLYNHRCGFFAQAEGVWYSQSNMDDDAPLADDSFWQVNLVGGYRFWQRRAEVRVGVLNVTDEGFHLNPLSYYSEPRRERTFVASLKLNF